MKSHPVFCDLATLDYRTSGHPEAPERISRSHARLKAAGHDIRPPSAQASSADVLLLHGPGHFKRVQDGTYDDNDTPHHPGIEKIALTSLSGAFSAADEAAAGRPSFSLMRPPGHHAGRDRVSGFCYFNNIALAVARLQSGKKVETIGILDIDVHHGDGTDELMTKRDGVLFCSLHQSPLYPGSGLKSHDNCHNLLIPPGTEESAYLKDLEKAIALLLDFKPSLIAVSAGFDTFKEDPIAGLKLDKKTYRRIGEMIAATQLPRFAVLEGGYAEELPILIENFLEGFLR